MEIKLIYKDEKRVVKAVWYAGHFSYTVTYILDGDGYVDKMITVFADGTVKQQ